MSCVSLFSCYCLMLLCGLWCLILRPFSDHFKVSHHHPDTGRQAFRMFFSMFRLTPTIAQHLGDLPPPHDDVYYIHTAAMVWWEIVILKQPSNIYYMKYDILYERFYVIFGLSCTSIRFLVMSDRVENFLNKIMSFFRFFKKFYLYYRHCRSSK